MAPIDAPSAYHAPVPEWKNESISKQNAYDLRIVLDSGEKLKEVTSELKDFKENFSNQLIDEPKIETPKYRIDKSTNILKLDKAKTLVLEVISTLKGLELPNGIFDVILFKNNQKKWGTMLEDFESKIKNESDAQRLVAVLDNFLDINKELVDESNRLTDNNRQVPVRGKNTKINVKTVVSEKGEQVNAAQRILKGPVEAIEWEGVVFGESVTVLQNALDDALAVMTNKQNVLYEQVNCITDQEKLIAKLKFEKIQLEQLLKANELELTNLKNPANQEKLVTNGKQLSQTSLENKSVELNKQISSKAEEIKNANEQLNALKKELPVFESAYNESKRIFDDANEKLKVEKLKIVSEHRNKLKDKLDKQIADNKSKLDEDQLKVNTLNGELTKIQTDVDSLLQKQSNNSAEFKPEDEVSLKENQKNRGLKVIEKVTTISAWMDRYVKSIISMQQKYYNEDKVNDQVRSPLQTKLKVVNDEIGLIDSKNLKLTDNIKLVDSKMKDKNDKAIKEGRKTNPLHIGEISMLEEEAIGYEKQQKYLESRKKELLPIKAELEKQIEQVNATSDALLQSIVYLNEKANSLLLQLNYKIVNGNLTYTKGEKQKITENEKKLSEQVTKYDAKVKELDAKIDAETDRTKKNALREELAKYSTDQLKMLQSTMTQQITELGTKEVALTSQRGKISTQATTSRIALEKVNKEVESKWTKAAASTEFGPQIAKPSVEVADPNKIPQNLIIEQQEEKK